MLTLTLFKIFPSEYIWPPPWPFRLMWRLRSRDHLTLICHCTLVCISIRFGDNGPKRIGLRDVFGHVANRSAIRHFLSVTHWNRVDSFSRFRDICHQIYPGHYLDLSGSRDVIGHVTNRTAICHFLSVSHWNRVAIFNRFRDIYMGRESEWIWSISLYVFHRLQEGIRYGVTQSALNQHDWYGFSTSHDRPDPEFV